MPIPWYLLPVSVNLLGKKVFSDVIKQGSGDEEITLDYPGGP